MRPSWARLAAGTLAAVLSLAPTPSAWAAPKPTPAPRKPVPAAKPAASPTATPASPRAEGDGEEDTSPPGAPPTKPANPSGRPEKGERAVPFDETYQAPSKDLLLSPANEKRADAVAHYLQGAMAEEAGDIDRALASYRKSLAADPANVPLALKVANEHVRRGDTNEAVEVLNRAAKAAPRAAGPPLTLAYIHLKALRKPDLAQKFAEQALTLEPGSFLGYAYLIDSLTQQGQESKVPAVLERAARSPSKDAMFWLRVGELHRQALLPGVGDENPAAVRRPGKSAADVRRPRELTEKKSTAKPIDPEVLRRVNALFAKAAQFAPSDPEVLSQVAGYYVVTGQITEAIPLYLKVLSLAPDQANVREKLAYSYLQSDQRAKAVEMLEEIIKRDPAQAGAYEMLAKIFEEDKQWERALRNYEQVLLLAPNTPTIYERMTVLWADELKRYDKAAEVLAEARKRFPDLPGFTYWLGRVLSVAKRHEEALDAFAQAEAEASQTQEAMLNAGFWFSYGAACEQAGRYEKAAVLLKRCLDSTDEPRLVAQAANYLGYMWADRNENLEEAGALIQRALSIDPENGAYLDSIGWYYYRVGKFDKALAELMRAVEKTDPPDVTVFDHIGDTYHQLGNAEKALAFWKKALEVEPANAKISAKVTDPKTRPAPPTPPAAEATSAPAKPGA